MSLSPPLFVITPLFNKFADMSDEPVKGTKIEKILVLTGVGAGEQQ